MSLPSRLASLAPCALALSVAACSSMSRDANATLADLPNLRVGGSVFNHDDGSRELSFGLFYDARAFTDAHGGDCATLDDSLGGRFDGKGMSVSTYGSEDDFDGCGEPYIDVKLSDAPTGELRIADDSLVIEAAFDGRSLARRHLTLRAPDAWQMGAGETVTVELSHPEDLSGAQLETLFHSGRNTDPNFFPIPAPVAAAPTVTFQLPTPLPVTGKGTIYVNLGYASAETLRCTGAARCSAQVKLEYTHAVELRR